MMKINPGRSTLIPVALVLAALAWAAGGRAPGPDVDRPARPAAAATWNELGPDGGDLRGVAFNPRNRKELTVVSLSGLVYKTANAGKTWTRTSILPEDLFDVAYAPSQPSLLYALGATALFRSEDGGKTWTRRAFPAGGRGDEGRLAVHPQAPDSVYAAGAWRAGSARWMTVFRTANGGKSWSAVKLAATSRDGMARGVAVDPGRPSTAFVVGGYDDTKKYYVFKTTDSGATWRDSTGAVQGLPYEIGVDPTDSNKVYAVTTHSFYKSSDGGTTWQDSLNNSFGRVLAIASGAPRILFASWEAHWIYKSLDAGKNWLHLQTDFNGDARRFATAPGDLRLATISGLIKSVNGGATWTTCQDGIRATRIAAVAAAPASRRLLYAVAYDFGFAKSADAGRTWSLLWPIYGCESIPCLSVHPRNSKKLLVVLESG
jgi:photosystem II stability/assembly factor-like uncharacterized protein